MTAPFFVDTNLLFYAEDSRDPTKRAKAQEILRQALSDGTGYISLQVLQEYFSAVTKKLSMPAKDARRRVELYSTLSVVQLRPQDVLAAIDLHRLHGFSIWDSLILRAALISGCQRLYTEDLQHGQRVEGLEIFNPFRSSP